MGEAAEQGWEGGMREEVVMVALQHHWPLPQQPQLCTRARGNGREVCGMALGTAQASSLSPCSAPISH